MVAAIRTLSRLREYRARRLAESIAAINLRECLSAGRGAGAYPADYPGWPPPILPADGKPATESATWRERYVRDAGEVLDHNFDLLGSGRVNIGESEEEGRGIGDERDHYVAINWHEDFKSGVEWERGVFYPRTQIIRDDGSDIKVPWELSRFQHLPTLGIAYRITGDERYAGEFIDEIEDWIAANPPLYGVNWSCAMEAAIRAVNWIWGYAFFAGSHRISEGWLARFTESLYVHGKYIRVNLERLPKPLSLAKTLLENDLDPRMIKAGWRGINTNHYLSELVGLIYLGTFFSRCAKGRGWRDFALKELAGEMERQIYPDGVDYEGSTSYHRLATELFLAAALQASGGSTSLPASYKDRLQKMMEFVMYYTKPDGTAPQIGDNDDGRLLILADYGGWNRLDHRYLLSTGAALFGRADFAAAAGEGRDEAIWLLGKRGMAVTNRDDDKASPVSSRSFPHGGFYIMRRDDLYMMVDCIPADRKASSSHRHNSRLSFELFAYDKSFIIDPGTYCYTGDKEMRNLFRSTRYHNTVVVDGEEQNEFDGDDPFDMGSDAAVVVNGWETGVDCDILDAEHRGYLRLTAPVLHRRRILFARREGYWIIRDGLTGEGSHRIDLYLHFAPMGVGVLEGQPLGIKTGTDGANLAVIPLEGEGLSVEIEEGWVSYRYGVKERAPVVRYSMNAELPGDICIALFPYMEEASIHAAVENAVSRAEALR
ncbi:MAG: alginate lyase family protein [Actinomycetota bacterium]|nr:alginate lyase family protein [Actinomycetota bacterium]